MHFSMQDDGPAAGISELTDNPSLEFFLPSAPEEDLPSTFSLIESAAVLGISAGLVDMALTNAAYFVDEPWRPHRVKRAMRKIAGLMIYQDKQQLPRDTFLVPWFESHVPHTGTIQVQHTIEGTKSQQFGLTIFGSTIFRAGRKMTVTATSDTEPIPVCTRNSVLLRGTPTQYVAVDGPGPWELEDVEHLEDVDEALDPCPYCSIRPDEIDLNTYKAARPLNRKNIAYAKRNQKQYKWERGFTFGIPIPLPHPIPLSVVTIGFSSGNSVTWDTDTRIPGGFRYQPYSRGNVGDHVPPMWAFE